MAPYDLFAAALDVAVAGGGGRQQGGGRAARRAVAMRRWLTKRQDGWGRREGPRNRPAGERGGVALRFWAAGAVAALDAAMTPSSCAGRRGDRVWEPGHRVAGVWRRLPHPPASAGERGAGTGCGNPGTERRRRGGGDHTPGRLAPGLQPIPAAEQADARPNRSPSVLRAPALFFESSRCLSAPCPLPARPHSALPRAACSELRSGLAPLRTYRVSSGARSDREVVSSWAQR